MHPIFSQLEQAAQKACTDSRTMLRYKMPEIFSDSVLRATLTGHSTDVACCAMFDNDKKALSGSWDSTLIVWDLSTGKQLAKLKGHMDGVRCCAVFDKDRNALSGSFDSTLIVWDLLTGKQLAKLEGHTKGVNCCAVFDNGRKALSMVFTE